MGEGGVCWEGEDLGVYQGIGVQGRCTEATAKEIEREGRSVRNRRSAVVVELFAFVSIYLVVEAILLPCFQSLSSFSHSCHIRIHSETV